VEKGRQHETVHVSRPVRFAPSRRSGDAISSGIVRNELAQHDGERSFLQHARTSTRVCRVLRYTTVPGVRSHLTR
jgi:hypothetical protein